MDLSWNDEKNDKLFIIFWEKDCVLSEFSKAFALNSDSDEYDKLNKMLINDDFRFICYKIVDYELKGIKFVDSYVKKYILGEIDDFYYVVNLGKLVINNFFRSWYFRCMNDKVEEKDIDELMDIIKNTIYNQNIDEIGCFFKETKMINLDYEKSIDLLFSMLNSTKDRIKIAKEIWFAKMNEYDQEFLLEIIGLIINAKGDMQAKVLRDMIFSCYECDNYCRFDASFLVDDKHGDNKMLSYMRYLKSIANATGEKQLECVVELYKGEGVSMQNVIKKLNVIELAEIISQAKDRNIAKFIYDLYLKYRFIIGSQSIYYGNPIYYFSSLRKIIGAKSIDKVRFACEYFENKLYEVSSNCKFESYFSFNVSEGVEIILDAVGILQSKFAYRTLSSKKRLYEKEIARLISQAVGSLQAHVAYLYYLSPLFNDNEDKKTLWTIINEIVKAETFEDTIRVINSYGNISLSFDTDEVLDKFDYELISKIMDFDLRKELDEDSIEDKISALDVSKKKTRNIYNKFRNWFGK